jgi:hypothetical protein
MESFVASVQYGDWDGTAAADDADQRDIHALLREKDAYDSTKEIVIGVKLWIGENHGGKVQAPYVTALIVDADGYDNVPGMLASQDDPIPVKRVELELTLEEFMGLFKRFGVVLTTKGLGLTGRTYTFND